MTKLTAVLIVVLGQSMGTNLFAQEQSPAPKTSVAPPPVSRPAPISAGPGRPVQRFDRLLQDLTPEQRTKLDEANKTFSEKATPLYSRLVTARREIETLVDKDKVDETNIRAKAKEIADLEADIAVARAERYVKFRTFLSAEQARRFNQPTPLGRPFQPALHEGQTPPPVAPNK